MATMQFKGLEEYIAQLQKIGHDTDRYCGRAIYDGAGYVAGRVVEATKKLPVDDSPQMKTQRSGIRTIQREALVKSLGIAKMRQDGTFWNVKIGYDGYNSVKTERWPQGQPNAMIARSVESGTSFLKKNAYLQRTTRNSKKKCEEIMRITIDKEIAALVK